MEKSIVQIDISILDKEIEMLKAELQKKTAMREYIGSLAKQFPAAGAIKTFVKTQTPAKATSHQPANTALKQTPVKAAPKQQPVKASPKQQATTPTPRGLTEFILDYLAKNPKSESKTVLNNFAAATGKKPADVKANVANTLSRLLRENKLKKQKGNGPGYLWSAK